MNKILPLYILIDGSKSMHGEGQASLNTSLESIFSLIRDESDLSRGVEINISVFGSRVINKKPLSFLDDKGIPYINMNESGVNSHLGMGLKFILDETMKLNSNNHISPMLIIMTDGYPSDMPLYEEMTFRIQDHQFSSIIVCLAGQNPDDTFMRMLTDKIFYLDSMDRSGYSQLIEDVYYQHQGNDGSTMESGLPNEIFID